jgi:hypothetical protein
MNRHQREILWEVRREWYLIARDVRDLALVDMPRSIYGSSDEREALLHKAMEGQTNKLGRDVGYIHEPSDAGFVVLFGGQECFSRACELMDLMLQPRTRQFEHRIGRLLGYS